MFTLDWRVGAFYACFLFLQYLLFVSLAGIIFLSFCVYQSEVLNDAIRLCRGYGRITFQFNNVRGALPSCWL